MDRFEEYVIAGIVVTRSPDPARAQALREESDAARDVLDALVASGLTDRNANIVIKLAYDVIMSRVRARMCEDGLYASGKGAHEAQIAYLETLGYDADVPMLDHVRYARNGIAYYGNVFDAAYARDVLELMRRVTDLL